MKKVEVTGKSCQFKEKYIKNKKRDKTIKFHAKNQCKPCLSSCFNS